MSARLQPYGDAAMTFKEIAHRLGMKPDTVHNVYTRAMVKIRRNHQAALALASLVAFKERECQYGEPVLAPNPNYSPRLRACASLEPFTEMQEQP